MPERYVRMTAEEMEVFCAGISAKMLGNDATLPFHVVEDNSVYSVMYLEDVAMVAYTDKRQADIVAYFMNIGHQLGDNS